MYEDIFKPLRKDHEEVKRVLALLKMTNHFDPDRDRLFSGLKKAIEHHIAAEEHVFYPMLRDKKEAEEEVLDSMQEHRVTEMILNEMATSSSSTGEWSSKLSVLKELVEHHIRKEEDNVFRLAGYLLDESEITTLKKRFEEEKRSVQSGAIFPDLQKARGGLVHH